MPFIAYKKYLIKYLRWEEDNLNPIFNKIFADGFCFYGVKEKNDLELININTYDDYKYIFRNFLESEFEK